ncbi:PilW family protein [Atopomonas hussainii]|uniref:PilW family protein n=1 Tax=Atopomonas hussainii TaxID=1429083 RepID=UPI0008FFF606|nr:PilW family protein [Atopomonas hussainii]
MISRKNNAGLSLVELMVGLALGLILLLGVLQVFLASRQTITTNDAMGKLQENGRFAMEFLARGVRLGGYQEPNSTATQKPFTVMPESCGISAASNGAPCTSNRIGSGINSDVLSISYEPPLIDGARRDCAGNTVSANQTIIVSYFILAADASAGSPQPSLACSSYNKTTGSWITQNQRLVDGIENLQVLYGISSTGDAKSVNEYVSADRVTARNKWSEVLAVRISVLANSLDAVSPTPPARNYYLLDANPVAANDQLARQIFTSTIQLKNTY